MMKNYIPKYYAPELIISEFSYLPKKDLENICVFVSNHLHRKNFTDNIDLPYHSKIIRRIFTQEYWDNTLKHLIRQIFDIDSSYQPGTISKTYRLKNKYAISNIVCQPFTNKIAIKRHLKNIKNAIEYNNKKNEEAKKIAKIGSGKNLFENAYLIENLMKLKINEDIFEYINKNRYILENKKRTMMLTSFLPKDLEAIDSELRNLQSLEYQALRIKNIKQDEYLLTENENTGRIYSIFTNLNKLIRYNYLIYPVSTTEIDIKTSYPTCLPILIQKVNQHHGSISFSNNIELQKYINFIKNNDFYSMFVTDKLDRNTVKTKVYNSFISCSLNIMQHSPIAKKFKSEFPAIYQFIVNYKKKYGHKAFTLALSKIESEIINPIARKYSKDNFVLTLFDAIYCDSEIADKINFEIISKFFESGVKAKTETKKVYQTIPKELIQQYEEMFESLDKKIKQQKDPSLGFVYGY